MLTIDTLREEHTGVLLVLDQLDEAVSAAEIGESLPKDVFNDIQEFFTVFVDRPSTARMKSPCFAFTPGSVSGERESSCQFSPG